MYFILTQPLWIYFFEGKKKKIGIQPPGSLLIKFYCGDADLAQQIVL